MSIPSVAQAGQFFRYCLVGVANTLVHILVVVTLIEGFGMNSPPANAMAFFVANVGSYAMNSVWTFRAALGVSRYIRFLLVSLFGLLLSYGCAFVAQQSGWHYLVGVMMSVVLVSIVGFVLGRMLVFSDRDGC